MDSIVAAFNQLPRPKQIPSGPVPNHWYFTIRHVPLDPPADIVQIIHPQSRFQHSGGPTQINSLSSLRERVNVIIPLLLEEFIKGLDRDPLGNPTPNSNGLAPWTWSTKDAELARALEARMKQLGVKKELCVIKASTQEDEDIANESWSHLVGQMMGMMGRNAKAKKAVAAAESSKNGQGEPACFQCGKTTEVKRCANCQSAWYCSRDCQKAHWKVHKRTCGAFLFYSHGAPTNAEARRLADEISIDLTNSAERGGLV
jgi:MYND finger